MSGLHVLEVGPGDPPLMARRAHDLLARADVLATDGPVPSLLLAVAPDEAVRVPLEAVAAITDAVIVVLTQDRERTLARLAPLAAEVLPGVPAAARKAWLAERPLRGARILVLRPREQALDTACELADQGALPEVCLISRIVDADPAALDGVLWPLPGAYEWIAFASVHGVGATFRAVARLGRDARVFAGTRVAAVGHATAEALAARGVRADIVPEVHSGAALARAMFAADPSLAQGGRVLLPRAQEGRVELAEELAAGGALVTAVVAYRNVPRTAAELTSDLEVVRRAEVDAVLFFAPSQVALVWDALGNESREILERVPVLAAIGPTTAEAMRTRHLRVDLVPEQASVEALAAALAARYGAR